MLETVSLKWINLQWPPTASIAVGGNVVVYFQCYEAGVTEPAGQASGITAWLGYSTTNTPPNTWSNWIPATFNVQYNNNDEFKASIGPALPSGLYYYASRFKYNSGPYQYGGFNPSAGGPWDGVNNVSGVLSVGKTLASLSIGNVLQKYDAKPKQVTVTTQPAGLTFQVTYNGSASLPVNAGTYKVVANITSAGYQGTQTGQLIIYQTPADASATALRSRFIWVMHDQVLNQNDLDAALLFKPDVIERAWFKWGYIADYSTWNYMVTQAGQKNSLLGGGGTIQALYPNEVEDAKFQRIVERTPLNEPMFFGNDPGTGCYCGDIQKKEYLDYLLGWLYKQVKAGASTLHLDGLSIAPTAGTGYSDYSMSEFNAFLTRKYITGQGWTASDSRWTSIFDIDLSLDCTNGTINTFDYRKYLKRNNYASNPDAFTYPLQAEWGFPWKYQNTYSGERNKKACEYVYTSLKHFADSIGKPLYVTMNGDGDNVDYQTAGVWDSWKVVNGKLDIEPSYISRWRGLKEYNFTHLYKDIPVLVFHDWGWGMPFFSDINEADRMLWLKVYTPEVFASGAIFAWPVSGGGTNYRPSLALRDTLLKLSSWYSTNREQFIGSVWNPVQKINLKGQIKLVNTVLDQYAANGDTLKKIIHLINKNIDADRKLVVRKNFSITVFSHKKPKSVYALSPDFNDARILEFTTTSDSIGIKVNSLEAYTLVVVDYAKKVPQTIHFNNITIPVPWNIDFSPVATASSGLPITFTSSNSNIATIVNGKIHILRDGTCNITASQTGNTVYEAAPNVTQSLVVSVVPVFDEKIDKPFRIYPNPCISSVFIDSPSEEPLHVQIFNIMGIKVADKFIDGNEMDVNELPQGYYVVKIGDFNTILIKK
jgi:hypothetical protein